MRKGAHEAMEAIISWRINPNRSTCAAIPQPFRPTPLQVALPKHNLAIACISWPSIRDQLILNSQAYDMEAVSRDIVKHTVFELHHLRVAVNTHELINRTAASSESTNREDYRSKAQSLLPLIEDNANLKPETLLDIISWRMEICEWQGNLDRSGEESSAFSSILNQSAKYRRSEMAIRCGVTDITRWKLSSEFQMLYPSLDCDAGTFLRHPVRSQVLADSSSDFGVSDGERKYALFRGHAICVTKRSRPSPGSGCNEG